MEELCGGRGSAYTVGVLATSVKQEVVSTGKKGTRSSSVNA